MMSVNRQEVTFAESPDLALAQYHELGYHIEPNVFTDEQCKTLIDASQQLENAKNKTYRPSMMPHRQDDIFRDAMAHPTMVNIISKLVDGKVSGLQSEFFYCKPGTRGFALHQDNFFVEAADGVFASAWAALTDTYPEKGGLIIYPKTNQAGKLPVRKIHVAQEAGQDPNANNEETIVPAAYPPVSVSVPKGAVLFIHGHLVHGSHRNTTNEWRYVLLNTYIRSGEPFRAGRYAQREEVCLT
jgi:phytanoyl-CoA hydroxylase